MNKMIMLFLSLTLLIFFSGCKAPACSTLSWGETSQVEENGVEMKFSAGKRCENINDYWDNVDVDELIRKIQKMKFVKVDNCIEENLETGESEIVECPEFIPEIIEFGEVVGCMFDTPAGEETLCFAGPLTIFFETDTFFKKVYWELNPENPEFYPPRYVENMYSVLNEDDSERKTMEGHFSDKSLTGFTILFSWRLDGKLKMMYIYYSVETKE